MVRLMRNKNKAKKVLGTFAVLLSIIVAFQFSDSESLHRDLEILNYVRANEFINSLRFKS